MCSTSWPTNFLVSEKQEGVGSILALNHKFFMLQKYSGDQRVPPLRFFFRHYATFFRKVLNFIKAYPFEFFEVFGLWKTFIEPKGSLFGVFGNMRLFYQILFLKKKLFSKCFQLLFLEYFWALDMAPTWAVPGLLLDVSFFVKPKLCVHLLGK